MMSEHTQHTPTPQDVKRALATAAYNKKRAVEALKLQSVRTGSVLARSFESEGYGGSDAR